jgi:hypothetical protein
MSRELDEKIIKFMKKEKIATMPEIKEIAPTSSSTIRRALKREGYVSSCNNQSSFYALKKELKFNKHGICIVRDVMFCEEGSLRKQIFKEVDCSEAGFTSKGIVEIYGKSARNILCQLNVNGKVQRKSICEIHYYFSINATRRDEQTVGRNTIIDGERAEIERLKQDTILFVMGQLSKKLTISPKGIQNRLRKIGISISVSEVKRIMNDYELNGIKKKG